MSSNESSAPRANPQALESVRCFGGQRFTERSVASAVAYVLVAAVTVFGCTRTAAATQGAEASLLVEGYGAARSGEAAARPGFLEAFASSGGARTGHGGIDVAEAASR
jgi:hypothetical protein